MYFARGLREPSGNQILGSNDAEELELSNGSTSYYFRRARIARGESPPPHCSIQLDFDTATESLDANGISTLHDCDGLTSPETR